MPELRKLDGVQLMLAELDLRMAWRRINCEKYAQSFVHHPFERKLIQVDLDGWLNELQAEVHSGSYEPAAIQIANAPKGNGHVRPGAFMRMKDRVVYYACVDCLLPKIRDAITSLGGVTDFSHRLSTDHRKLNWIAEPFVGWSSFRSESEKLLEGHPYVVLADITGYYENIDLAVLRSDLLGCGSGEAVLALLMKCLNRWAQVGGRGLPQGQTASDILAKLYLNSVDQRLRNDGYRHLRYVDDFRIFCKSSSAAKRALVVLTETLRGRGLNLQSSKSAIHRADSARDKINGITAIIEDVRKALIADLLSKLELGPYFSCDEIGSALQRTETPVEVLRETFKAYFIEDVTKFDKTLFHYLIKRLGEAKDRFAVDQCYFLLTLQPQETSYVLNYFSVVGVELDVLPAICDFLRSESSVYDYQVYQIIDWAHAIVTNPNDSFLQIVRRYAFLTRPAPPYLVSKARHFLAERGNQADLERMATLYSNAQSSIEQAELMCCLHRMEKMRRNAFIARAENDGPWNQRASKFIRAIKVAS